MSTKRRLVWKSAADSHVGMVRKINEDAYLDFDQIGLWAVADGMGGHEAGDVASKMIVDTLREISPPTDMDKYIASVKDTLDRSNRRLRDESAQRYHNRTIGSTVVIMLIHQDRVACIWVGDSRIYRMRNGRLQQLTRDHSHVQDLLDQGLIDAEEAHNHPLSNVITRAIGSSDKLMIDVEIFTVQAGDVFLLCSDGLTKVVSEKEITLAMGLFDSEQTVKTLIQMALNQGASDNVTTVVINIDELEVDIDPEATTIPIPDLNADP